MWNLELDKKIADLFLKHVTKWIPKGIVEEICKERAKQEF